MLCFQANSTGRLPHHPPVTLVSLGSVFYELAYSLSYNLKHGVTETMVSVNQAFQLFGMHYLRVPTHL